MAKSKSTAAVAERVTPKQPKAVPIVQPPGGQPALAENRDSDIGRLLRAVNEMDADDLHWFAEQVETRFKQIHDKEAKPEIRLSLDKASPEFRRVVEWLVGCTTTSRLAAVLASELLTHEGDFKRDGNYDGNIGNDIFKDWTEQLARKLGDPDCFDDPEDAAMAGFAIALSDTKA